MNVTAQNNRFINLKVWCAEYLGGTMG